MYRSEARERMELGRNTRDSVWLRAREWVLRGTNSDGNPLRAFIREVICVRCSRKKNHSAMNTTEGNTRYRKSR